MFQENINILDVGVKVCFLQIPSFKEQMITDA